MPENKIQITLELIDKLKGALEESLKGIQSAMKGFSDQAKQSLGQDTKDASEKGASALGVLKDGWISLWAKVSLVQMAYREAKAILYDSAKDIAAQSMAIETQARMLGMSTTELQKWQYAVKMSGVDAESFSSGVRWLSRNMDEASRGMGGSIKYFNAMGISVTDSAGNLKSLDTIMGEIADKFASWEDGPRKIAVALGLFGRGGEMMVPLLNKGQAGIHDLMDEAVKLGTVLGDVTVKKGSQAEDIFKRIEAQVNATKLSLAPLALGFAQMVADSLNELNKLKKWWDESPWTKGLKWGAARGTEEEYKKMAAEEGVLPLPSGEGVSGKKLTDLWETFGAPKEQPPIWREDQILKFKQALSDIILQYSILTGNVSLQEKTYDQINALKIKEINLNEQLTAQEKGALIAAVQRVAPEERKARELERAAPIAESQVQQAQQLGNINLIQEAEKALFEIKMKQLAKTKDFTPELEKQLRATFDIEQAEKRRAAEAEYYKYPQYEAPPVDWETAGLKLIEDRKKAILDLRGQYADLTGDLQAQMQVSKDLETLEIQRINREAGGDQDLIDLTKKLSDAKRQQMVLDSQRAAIDIQRQTREMAGDWEGVKVAEIAALEVERQSLLLKNQNNKGIQDQINSLYDMKEAELEAQRTMNIPALMDIGIRKATIQANQDLAVQFENLIPNAVRTGTDAVSNFFQNLTSGTMSAKDALKNLAKDFINNVEKMITNVVMLIAQMEILKALGKEQTTTTGGGGVSIGSLVGGFIGALLGTPSTAPPAGYMSFGAGINELPTMGGAMHGGRGPGEPPTFYEIVPSFPLAKRLHEGIGPDELPAIIRKDESVLTPGQMKALTPVTSQRPVLVNVNMIVNTPNADSFRNSQDQITGKLLDRIKKGMRNR